MVIETHFFSNKSISIEIDRSIRWFLIVYRSNHGYCYIFFRKLASGILGKMYYYSGKKKRFMVTLSQTVDDFLALVRFTFCVEAFMVGLI